MPVELAAVVASAVETSQPLIQTARHNLTVSMPSMPIVLLADATRLGQIIANLLNNAAKYTPQGGTLQLNVLASSNQASIHIIDNGVGISAEMLPKVFDMFTQVDPSTDRSQGGLGIGLTLVRTLVEMHSGTVEANSKGRGYGSEFVVRLPWDRSLIAPAPVMNSPQPSEQDIGLSRRILIIDDNADAADSLATVLDMHWHHTRTAYDGPSGILAAQEFLPDIILLDIGLPGMSGYEVARKLRQDPIVSETMLIALTGWGSEDDQKQTTLAGFDYHVTKPADPVMLLELLSKRRNARS